jgi:hypothetical protein
MKGLFPALLLALALHFSFAKASNVTFANGKRNEKSKSYHNQQQPKEHLINQKNITNFSPFLFYCSIFPLLCGSV